MKKGLAEEILWTGRKAFPLSGSAPFAGFCVKEVTREIKLNKSTAANNRIPR